MSASHSSFSSIDNKRFHSALLISRANKSVYIMIISQSITASDGSKANLASGFAFSGERYAMQIGSCKMLRPSFDTGADRSTASECTVGFTSGATAVQRAGLLYRWYSDAPHIKDGGVLTSR